VVAVGVPNQACWIGLSNGGLRRETKIRGGDLIAQLYDWKLFASGSLDFEATAREYGKRALHEFIATQHDAPVITEAQIAEWVEMPLDILSQGSRPGFIRAVAPARALKDHGNGDTGWTGSICATAAPAVFSRTITLPPLPALAEL
jgi:hypothetical protein